MAFQSESTSVGELHGNSPRNQTTLINQTPEGQLKNREPTFSEAELSRIIEMAWEDRTPFDAISASHGIGEQAVIALMRRHLKSGSFRAWRKRVSSRSTKHLARRPAGVARAYCPTQYKHR